MIQKLVSVPFSWKSVRSGSKNKIHSEHKFLVDTLPTAPTFESTVERPELARRVSFKADLVEEFTQLSIEENEWPRPPLNMWSNMQFITLVTTSPFFIHTHSQQKTRRTNQTPNVVAFWRIPCNTDFIISLWRTLINRQLTLCFTIEQCKVLS